MSWMLRPWHPGGVPEGSCLGVCLWRGGDPWNIDMTFITRFLKEREVTRVDNDTRVGNKVQNVSTLVVFFEHLEHGWFRFSSQYFCDHSFDSISSARWALRSCKNVCAVYWALKRRASMGYRYINFMNLRWIWEGFWDVRWEYAW